MHAVQHCWAACLQQANRRARLVVARFPTCWAQELGKLGATSYFGERALLLNEPRAATVRALTGKLVTLQAGAPICGRGRQNGPRQPAGEANCICGQQARGLGTQMALSSDPRPASLRYPPKQMCRCWPWDAPTSRGCWARCSACWRARQPPTPPPAARSAGYVARGLELAELQQGRSALPVGAVSLGLCVRMQSRLAGFGASLPDSLHPGLSVLHRTSLPCLLVPTSPCAVPALVG